MMLALALSGVFFTAAVAKFLDRWAFWLTVRDLLPAVPRGLVRALAAGVIVLELLVALLFVTGSRPLGLAAATGTGLLAVAFAGAGLLAHRAPHAIRCRCFGGLGSMRLSGRTVPVAVGLAVAAAVWAVGAGPWVTVGAWPARLAALLPGAVVLAGHALRPARQPHRTGAAP